MAKKTATGTATRKKAARKKSTKKKAASRKPPAPAMLEMSLFAPGMSLMHRAGLGGLVCTLEAIHRDVRDGRIIDDNLLPGGPWPDVETPPWTIEPQRVVLHFGEPGKAAEYLQRLFAFAFQIQGGLLYLPGQYGDREPPVEVRALLQLGMTLTFLQHGKSRTLATTVTTREYEADGKLVSVEFKECSGFKHQSGWKDLVDQKKGTLKLKPSEVVGPLSPGSVVRHVAYASKTRIEDTPDRLLPLYFALVGCLALPINRGCGVLVVPEVEDLHDFIWQRPTMTPREARQCQITSPGDAALQAQVRLKKQEGLPTERKPRTRVRPLSDGAATHAESRLATLAAHSEIIGCHASVFQPTAWASQQKSRVRTLIVEPGNDEQMDRLDVFDAAVGSLRPRVATRTVKESTGRGKQKVVTERQEHFWSNSVVRPLVADNLARGRPWYAEFTTLMTRLDPVSKKPIRDRLGFEKEGLRKMTEQQLQGGESAVVRAVHTAIGKRYGVIAKENKTNSAAMKNRWKGEYNKWRLAFAGAKTPDQFRTALCDLFSRAGVNDVLQAEWESVILMLRNETWQQTRDLALLGLASYSGKGAEVVAQPALTDGDVS